MTKELMPTGKACISKPFSSILHHNKLITKRTWSHG